MNTGKHVALKDRFIVNSLDHRNIIQLLTLRLIIHTTMKLKSLCHMHVTEDLKGNETGYVSKAGVETGVDTSCSHRSAKEM